MKKREGGMTGQNERKIGSENEEIKRERRDGGRVRKEKRITGEIEVKAKSGRWKLRKEKQKGGRE